MKRIAVALVVLAVAAIAVYWFALRDSSTTTAAAAPPRAVAQIGEGKRVILVGSDGRLLGATSGKSSGKSKEQSSQLPVLPLKERPKGDRVSGHVREQVNVIAAAPKALRHYIARTDYGKTGWTWNSTPASKSASATIAERKRSGKRPQRYLPIRP